MSPTRQLEPDEAGDSDAPVDPKFSDPSAAKNAALRLLTRKARSRRDLSERLEAKGYTTDAVERALADLARVGLVDDAALARDMVRGYIAAKPAGERFLLQKLRQYKVDDGVAKDAVREALAERDQGSDAERLIRSRARTIPPKATREAAYRRLLGAAARRGFDPETARAAVDRVMAEMEFPDRVDGDAGR